MLKYFEKVRDSLSPEKLFTTLLTALVFAVGAIVYEVYTAHLELSRYERALKILNELETRVLSSDVPSIKATANAIAARVEEIVVEGRTKDESLSGTTHRSLLALALGIPWIVFSFTGVVEGVRRDRDWHYGLFGLLAIGALLGTIGYAIPTELHWLLRYVAIPLSVVVILALLFLLFGDDDDDEEA